MNSISSTKPSAFDDDLRFLRVVRAARAVAATIIVGGIAFAAIQAPPAPERLPASEAMPEAPSDHAASEPVRGAAPANAQGARDANVATKRVDHARPSRG